MLAEEQQGDESSFADDQHCVTIRFRAEQRRRAARVTAQARIWDQVSGKRRLMSGNVPDGLENYLTVHPGVITRCGHSVT
jgi:hypothetical protein